MPLTVDHNLLRLTLIYMAVDYMILTALNVIVIVIVIMFISGAR